MGKHLCFHRNQEEHIGMSYSISGKRTCMACGTVSCYIFLYIVAGILLFNYVLLVTCYSLIPTYVLLIKKILPFQ
uniref:Gasa4 n=1 Tax=Solanum tuberosum TaxID=4113 RepID=M1BQ27_SOLTU